MKSWASEEVGILAPLGRDAQIAAFIVETAGRTASICQSLQDLISRLDHVACAIVAEEAFLRSDLSSLSKWVSSQAPWSDLPFILLTTRGEPPPQQLVSKLGNVVLLERPFHPETLRNAVLSACRARSRQRAAERLLREKEELAARQDLLIRELHHRVRNTLSTVQALFGATSRTIRNFDDFYATFAARLTALSDTHNMLTEDYRQSASLSEMLQRELAPYRDTSIRAEIDGPDIRLGADCAIPMGMAIHELVTNAVKHGALSRPSGSLSIGWVLLEGAPPRVELTWREMGGPPVRPPSRSGFGTILLDRVLKVQCDCQIHREFCPTGLFLQLNFPLQDAQHDHADNGRLEIGASVNGMER